MYYIFSANDMNTDSAQFCCSFNKIMDAQFGRDKHVIDNYILNTITYGYESKFPTFIIFYIYMVLKKG